MYAVNAQAGTNQSMKRNIRDRLRLQDWVASGGRVQIGAAVLAIPSPRWRWC